MCSLIFITGTQPEYDLKYSVHRLHNVGEKKINHNIQSSHKTSQGYSNRCVFIMNFTLLLSDTFTE